VSRTSVGCKPRGAADAVAYAVRHRLRVDILTFLHTGPASAKELATGLREPLSNVTHHIDELRDAGAIEVAFTKKVGNVEQNHWRALTTSTYSADELSEMSLEDNEVISRIIVQSVMAEMLAALRAGHLARDPYSAKAWDRVLLDDVGHKDVSKASDDFFSRVYEIAAESAGRVAESGAPLTGYIAAVMAFEQSRSEPNTTATVGHLGAAGS